MSQHASATVILVMCIDSGDGGDGDGGAGCVRPACEGRS